MKNDFYVYLHCKKNTGEPFYIGKGKNNRCYETRSRSEFWHNIVNKYGFDVFILENNLSNEDSLKREIYYINKLGRIDIGTGILVNHTDGGSAIFNLSKEIRKKMSERHLGNKYRKDKNHSDLTKNILSIKNTGSNHPNYGKTGKWLNIKGKNAPASKKIIQYDINNNIVKEYECIMEAYNETGILNTSISNNLKGLSKVTIGNNKNKYTWKYGN